ATVTIQTYDCFQNQIQSADTEVIAIDWNKINPPTGPLFVEDALPGAVLKVKIERIDIGNQGVMVVGPELGVKGHALSKMESKILPIQDGRVQFNELQIPVNKISGVIGVAPEAEGVNC